MRYRPLAVTACLLAAACVTGRSAAVEPDVSPAQGGMILDPAAGEYLAFCDAPELDVTVKFGLREHSRAMTVGTASLAVGKSNFGKHSADEIIHFLSGSALATVGETRREVRAGSTMFVPRGVHHGFETTGSAPLEFFWIQSPAGFEERLRDGAVRSLNECKRS